MTTTDTEAPLGAEARSSLLPATTAQWTVLVAGLLVLAAAAGFLVAWLRDAPPDSDSVDVGFLQDMSSHHEQAIELSNVALVNDVGPDVAVFAREILFFQGWEMGLMERQLHQWGYRREQRPDIAMGWMGDPTPVDAMPGLAAEADVERLRQSSGPEAAALFVELMQAHHEGGVHMADYAAEHASDPFVRDLAQRMARNQAIEIQELEAAAKRADLPEVTAVESHAQGEDDHGHSHD